ncbi:MAG TPA: AAA family ATPase, partial [Candidatus Cloacimonadota bacterium]|nr:AAA family ATPase [Candidatus Cloacimonadota bacterium]
MKMVGIEPVEILQKLIELKPPGQRFDVQDQSEVDRLEAPAQKSESSKKLLNRHIRSLIKHPLLERYGLTNQDVLVIADLWQDYLEHPGRGINWSGICMSAKIKRYRVVEGLEYLTSLLARNILCFDEKISGNYYLNPTILQSAEFTLSTDMILRILGRDLSKDLEQVLKEEWQDNDDFFGDLRLVFETCYDSFAELGSRSPVIEYPILSSCLNLLKARIFAAPDNLAIKALICKHGLCENQLSIMLLVMYHRLCREEKISEDDLLLSLAPDPRLRVALRKLLSPESLLISEGLIDKFISYHRSRIAILGIPYEMLESLGYKSKTNADIMPEKVSSYFQKCCPEQTLDALIIPAADKTLLTSIINKCQTNMRSDMEKWGFKREGSKPGLVLLLYGAPGTGKTFTAGAIANELATDLLVLNVPELRNKYYGETEKLIKRAFSEMRKLAMDETNAPVFLLNEADQLIHNRIASTSTCSTIENNIQSIILEELETFPGILILTTNLESNLDEAFFRRFDLKFKFHMPDLENRRKLWKL